jgi:anti-sigma regulatory factor (Ser/Thr protein kinase)
MLDDPALEISRSTASLHEWARGLPEPVCETAMSIDLSALYLFREMSPDRQELATVRATLTAWAQAVGFTGYGLDDVVLAVDEAVTNAIEHGYRDRPDDQPGRVVVFAGCTPVQRMVHLVVADHGCWRPPPADPGIRGRGLSIITKVTERFDLHPSEHGTVAQLGWKQP